MTMIKLQQMPKYSAYKDSGVEWLGEIPEGWEVKALKYVAYMESGSTIAPEDFTEEGFPVFGGNGFRGYTDKFTNDGKHVLIGRQGALCGNVNYAEGRFFASEHAVVVYPLNNEDVLWLGEAIRIADFNRFSQSAAQPGIAVNIVKNVLFPYPPLPEQTAIAAFLDKKTAHIDAAVGIKQKQIALLKERKQILIQNAVTQGLNPNAPMRDSGVEWIGEIPAHWEVKRLRFLGDTQNGISASAEYFGSGYPFVSYSDVYNNRQLPEKVGGLAKSSDEDRKQYSIQKGDVLFTRTSETIDEIGFASTCLKTINQSTFAGFLIRFRPRTKELFDGFSKLYFNAPMLRKYFVKEMNLVIRASLSQELLKNLLVLLPPFKEQTAIVTHIETQSAKIDQAIDLQQQQIEKLKEYKATLINSAVTGKIRVV